MEYVSKHIEKIAQEKGYCHDLAGIRYYKLMQFIFSWENVGDFAGDKLAKQYTIDWLEEWYNTLIPELQDMINDCSSCKHYIHKNEVSKDCENYEIAIPKHEGWRCDKHISKIQTNEFVLEGFIGMLLNWFEKNGIIMLINIVSYEED